MLVVLSSMFLALSGIMHFVVKAFILWRDLMISHHDYHHLLWALLWREPGWSRCMQL